MSPSDFPEKVWLVWHKLAGRTSEPQLLDPNDPLLAHEYEEGDEYVEVQPYFSASLVAELAKAGDDAWSEIEEALNSFGEGTLDEGDLLIRLRATQSKLLPCTEAQSSLGVKG